MNEPRLYHPRRGGWGGQTDSHTGLHFGGKEHYSDINPLVYFLCESHVNLFFFLPWIWSQLRRRTKAALTPIHKYRLLMNAVCGEKREPIYKYTYVTISWATTAWCPGAFI